MQGCFNHGNESPYVFKTVLQSRFDVEAAAYAQGRLPKKTFSSTFIVFSLLSREPLAVVHLYVIKALYDIPEQLLNIVTHFMILSK
jgi:hypothetical protein